MAMLSSAMQANMSIPAFQLLGCSCLSRVTAPPPAPSIAYVLYRPSSFRFLFFSLHNHHHLLVLILILGPCNLYIPS